MNPTTTFLRLLWNHLSNCTADPDARLCLVRTMRARPVTGGPIHGWSA